MIALSTQPPRSFLHEALRKILVIKNSMFVQSKSEPIRNTYLSDQEFKPMDAGRASKTYVKLIDSSPKFKKVCIKMMSGGEIFPCAHPDADETIHVLKGCVKNVLADCVYKEFETYKIPRNEPHHLVSEAGCELIINWDF